MMLDVGSPHSLTTLIDRTLLGCMRPALVECRPGGLLWRCASQRLAEVGMFLALFLLILAGQAEPSISTTPESVAAATQPNGPGLWIGGIAFTPEDVAAAEQQFDPETAVPVVFLTFSETGQRKFAVAQQGRVGDVLEIAVDGALVSSPVLVEPIAGAAIMIAGNFTVAEAVRLAERLRGSPAPR